MRAFSDALADAGGALAKAEGAQAAMKNAASSHRPGRGDFIAHLQDETIPRTYTRLSGEPSAGRHDPGEDNDAVGREASYFRTVCLAAITDAAFADTCADEASILSLGADGLTSVAEALRVVSLAFSNSCICDFKASNWTVCLCRAAMIAQSEMHSTMSRMPMSVIVTVVTSRPGITRGGCGRPGEQARTFPRQLPVPRCPAYKQYPCRAGTQLTLGATCKNQRSDGHANPTARRTAMKAQRSSPIQPG
jgi:hypothetical protein